MIIAGLHNQDSSYFEITSNKVSGRVLNEDIISFSYTEESGKYNSGMLTINDSDHYYSRVLKQGVPLNISFGYRSFDTSLESIFLSRKNPNQVRGLSERINITMRVNNTGGAASSNGTAIFNCGFYGKESKGQKYYRTHKNITKGALVNQLLIEMGCVISEVNFTRQGEPLSNTNELMQRETNYRLLNKLARKWRTVFKTGFNPAGQMTGIFISPSFIGAKSIPAITSGAIGGDSIYLDWKEGTGNVIEYNWKNQASDSGAGDNVRIITGLNGQRTLVRYVTRGGTVTAYKLRPDIIAGRLEKAEDFAQQIALMKEWLSADDFDEVAWAFEPYKQSFAPQGFGYSMQVKMLGNPLASVPLKVLFGDGFPVWYTPKIPALHISKFYCRKITHTIDRGGYKMDLDIVDAFTLTGGSLI